MAKGMGAFRDLQASYWLSEPRPDVPPFKGPAGTLSWCIKYMLYWHSATQEIKHL
jgi:hypothetical protein